jgi:hypothetical protein
MILDESERWEMCLTTNTLSIPISGGDLQRLRCYIDRQNRVEEKYDHGPEPLDPDAENAIIGALIECMEAGLSEDEADAGLEAQPWGDLISWDVAEEERHRGEG